MLFYIQSCSFIVAKRCNQTLNVVPDNDFSCVALYWDSVYFDGFKLPFWPCTSQINAHVCITMYAQLKGQDSRTKDADKIIKHENFAAPNCALLGSKMMLFPALFCNIFFAQYKRSYLSTFFFNNIAQKSGKFTFKHIFS